MTTNYVYQTAIYYTNGRKIYQHCPLQGPPKYTQIVIFGLKINHLATVFSTTQETSKEAENVAKSDHGAAFLPIGCSVFLLLSEKL
jgi:hypothetical protein